MSSSSGRLRGVTRVKKSVLTLVLVGTMALQFSPSQAEATGAHARIALESVINGLRKPSKSARRASPLKPKQVETQGQREAKVSHISLCPRRVLMYVGEQHMLSPLPLDNSREAVHGAVFTYENSDAAVVEVGSDGSVIALKPGECFVTASVGQKRAKVKVEVRDGPRPRLTNAEWDLEHAKDCKDPEQDPSAASDEVEIQSRGDKLAKPPLMPQLLPEPDLDPPPNVSAAPSRPNAVGHPRFSPNLALRASALSSDNQLGSSSFNLSIPIFGSGGRGVGVDLSLIYNSRMWTKDSGTNKIVFDYDVGWPAPGFRLNYGRIIRDYNVASGSGDYLLIEADGTRTPLLKQGNTNVYRSNDGRYIEFETAFNNLSLTDGTVVGYEAKGPNKLFPASIRDVNGNLITISYVASCEDALRIGACDCNTTCSRPARQAIKQISDTLGRFVSFYYNSTGQLVEMRVPGYNGAQDRVAAKFAYQTITLAYNFGSMTVAGAPAGGQVDVLKRVYFPDTGRGYVFDSYSGYGMFTHASSRLGMTDASDGTEVAYTEYTFNTAGQLDDAPQYTERREWWQGKTDDSGAAVTSPAVYTYSRTSNSSTTTNTVSGPSGSNSTTTVMVSNNDSSSDLYGLLTEQRIEKDAVVKLKQEFFYDSPSTQQGLQRNTVITTDDGSPTAKQTQVVSVFGQYGRLTETIEYGFGVAGVFTKRRRTVYSYLDTTDYITAGLYKLVTEIIVYDTLDTNNNGNDVKIARTGFVYDTADAGWEIATYGFTHNCTPGTSPPCTPPPGYNTKFADRAFRGLVTKTQSWSDAETANADITFRHQYDIFGNELKAEVGCCSLKRFTFSPNATGMFYSAPLSATDGPASGPNLAASFAYDFNTSFVNSQTDANGLVTSYMPDAAMRLRTVTYPKLTGDANANPTLETFFADGQNNPSSTDTLVYQSRFTYFDGATQKVQISNQWLDGAGRAVRQGSASGPTIASFDAVKSIYDDLGRLRKSTNPYNTTSSDGNTTGLPNATVYDYDEFSRVGTVTLPDLNTITTSYNGALTTVTDQVGRQRQSEVDGLSRTIKVTEMDNSKQLTWDTTYGYDKNDNLTSVNQGGQTRAFRYDSLSRMSFERTPEQDATINDGTGTLWSTKYTYTSFSAIATRQDARGVVKSYSYDGLNRLFGVAYDTTSTTAQATASVSITYGTAAPKLGQVVEIKQADLSNNTPWKESYDYDGLSRAISKTLSFDNQAFSYATGYGYNQASQLTQMTYPSTKVVKYGFDSRGRLNTVGEGSLVGKYVSSIGYQPSQQVATIGLGNGLTENYGYSSDRLQLTSQNVKQGTNTLMSLSYNYIADKSRSGGVGSGQANTGQLMDITGSQINSQVRNESYSYDQVARLVQAGGFYAQRNYTYDRWGNRTGVSGGSSQSVALQQPGGVTNNRIASVNSGPSYQYDAAGNTTFDAAHGFSYDAESRIVNVDSGSTATYFYDAANRRVKKLAGGFTTYYVWEGSNVIAEYGNAPAGAGGTRFFHPDRLSNRMITDGSGVVKGTMDNLPFGEGAGIVGESEKHRFTNYERDSETGNDYAINRQHSNGTGRFMRPDPVAGSTANPQSMNRFAYTMNDPINLVDPLGLFLPGTGGEGDGSNKSFDPSQCYTLIVDGIEVGTIGNCGAGGGGQTGGGGGPQNPGPSPTTPQTPVYCRPDVMKAMNTAWSRSGNAGMARSAGSVGVEAGFNLNGTPSNYKIDQLFTNQSGKMTIKFNIGGSSATFANFHIHPKGGDANNGMPSTPGNNYEGNKEGDTGMVDRINQQRGQAVQIYVMSWYGLAIYDPKTKQSTQLVKGTGFLKGDGCPR